MNPIYAILEHPHHWLILAGISFAAGLLGAMAMLAWGWAHWFDEAWLLVGSALTLYFLVRAFLEWKASVGDPEPETAGES